MGRIMENNSRTNKSIKNSIYALSCQIITIVLNFISRTVFIHTLGAVYLGLNGLFTNLLSVLSFAELGFSTAIIYEMYSPIATNDQHKIAGLMNLYAKIYRYIGSSIFIIGLFFIPFLNNFIKDSSILPIDSPPLWVIYLLFLCNSSSSYFFNYKRSIIVASQNGYIDTLNQIKFNLIKNILQIIILYLFESFIFYLVIQLICTLLGNISISVKANKLFPYLKKLKQEKVESTTIKSIKKNVFAMAFNKLGGVVVGGIDNLFISKYIGVIAVGYYSNYLLIITTIRMVFIQIFSPITASVGNFVVNKTKEESYTFFKKLFFINTYFAIISSICLATSINPFISIFWGDEYVLSILLTLTIVLNFYIDRIRQSSQIYIDVKGLFWQIKWRSFTEAIINIILVLSFIKYGMGLEGVILGILITNLVINFWWEPYVVFKYYFHQKLWKYFKWNFQYFITAIVSYLIIIYLLSFFHDKYIYFMMSLILSLTIPNIIFFIFYHNSPEFIYLLNIIKNNILKKIIKR